MLYGNIEVLGNEPVGTMFILVKGNDDQLASVPAFLGDKDVEVTRIDERGIWND